MSLNTTSAVSEAGSSTKLVACVAGGGGCNAAGAPPLEGVPNQVVVQVIPLPNADALLTDADRAVLSEDPTTKPCIHSPLPTIADSQRSSSIPIDVLIAMSRRENYLRRDDARYQVWMKLMHGALASTKDYENAHYHREVVRKEPFMSRDLLEHLQIQVLAEFGYFKVPDRWVDPTSTPRSASKALGEFDENWSRPKSFHCPDDAPQEEQDDMKAQYDEFEEVCSKKANGTLALYELRTAGMQNPDVPEFQDTIYFKYNRVGFEGNCGGRVFPGKEAPNCVLYDPPVFTPTTTAATTEAADKEAVAAAAVGDAGGVLDTADLARTTLHEILRRSFPEDVENNLALKAALLEAGVSEERAARAHFQCTPRFIITGSYT